MDGQIRSEDEGLGFSKDMLVLAIATCDILEFFSFRLHDL